MDLWRQGSTPAHHTCKSTIKLGCLFYYSTRSVWRSATRRQWFRTGDECHCFTYLLYCTVLYLDFARWSILDVVDSRRSVNVVTCIISCIGSGIFWNGFFEMPEEYITVDHGRPCGRSFSIGWADVVSVCMSRVVYRIHGGKFGDSSRTVGCVCVTFMSEVKSE